MKNREIFIKKLLYKSCNRGCRETDFILGNYAKDNLCKMNDEQLEDFSILLEIPDQEIYSWYTGKKSLPNDKSLSIMHDIMDQKHV